MKAQNWNNTIYDAIGRMGLKAKYHKFNDIPESVLDRIRLLSKQRGIDGDRIISHFVHDVLYASEQRPFLGNSYKKH